MIPNIPGVENIIAGFSVEPEMQAAIEYWKDQQIKEEVPTQDIQIVENAIYDCLNGEDIEQFGGRYFVVNAFGAELDASEAHQISITELPEIFGFDKFRKIQHFEINHAKNLKRLPISMNLMTEIEHFNVNNCGLEEIEGDLIRNNPKIAFFNVANNNLPEIPVEISDLTDIEILDLSGNKIQFLPDMIGNLENTAALEPELKLNDNQLSTLPSSIEALTKWYIAYRNNPFLTQNPFERIRNGILGHIQDENLGKSLMIQLSQYRNDFRSVEDMQWLDLTMRLIKIDENNRRLVVE